MSLIPTSQLLLSANFSAALVEDARHHAAAFLLHGHIVRAMKRLLCALDPSGTAWQDLSWIKGAREADISLRFGPLSSQVRLPSPSSAYQPLTQCKRRAESRNRANRI